VEGAVEKSNFKPEKIIVWQREQKRWDPILKEKGQLLWQDLVKDAKKRGLKADCVPVKGSMGCMLSIPQEQRACQRVC